MRSVNKVFVTIGECSGGHTGAPGHEARPRPRRDARQRLAEARWRWLSRAAPPAVETMGTPRADAWPLGAAAGRARAIGGRGVGLGHRRPRECARGTAAQRRSRERASCVARWLRPRRGRTAAPAARCSAPRSGRRTSGYIWMGGVLLWCFAVKVACHAKTSCGHANPHRLSAITHRSVVTLAPAA